MRKTVLFGVLMLLSSAAWAELEIIALRHRSAEDVLPLIRPLLDKDGVASGMNYQLILRTSPRNLDEIRKLLESVDVAPRHLRITVMQNVGREGAGLTVEAGGGADTVRARALNTASSEEDRKTQHILVLEGGRALVNTGQSFPVTQRQVVRSPWGTRVEESTQYRDVVSGFYVLPRLSGDRVTLEISAQDDSVAGGSGNPPAIRTQQVTTTVSGKLGEWLDLGETSQQVTGDGATLSARSASSAQERRSVLLKVEEAD